MTSLPALAIEAVVDPLERAPVSVAVKLLVDALSVASGTPHSTTLRFRDSLGSIGRPSERTVVVASLLREIAVGDERLEDTEIRWRDQLKSLEHLGIQSTLICTIFRHVGSRENPGLVERIARLNLMAVRLSHATGVGVVDIDQAFGYPGGRLLQTDYRLGGRLAAQLAGHTIVENILGAGLDDVIPPDVLERAQKVQMGMLDGLRREITS